MNYAPAKAVADNLVRNLRDRCERIEIAGSLRRMRPVVGDIEIVCAPKFQIAKNLFNEESIIGNFLELAPFCEWGAFTKNGSRYKQIALNVGINLDLFIVLPPADWGVIFAIRTGPADFSRKCVTKRNMGGYLPSDCRVEDGQVLRGGTPIYDEIGVIHHWEGGEHLPMSEEIDFLSFLGLGWIDPENRK